MNVISLQLTSKAARAQHCEEDEHEQATVASYKMRLTESD